MKLAALVNDNYEYELFREELGEECFQRNAHLPSELEFMFFFMNRRPELALKNVHNYDQHYRENLQRLGLRLPEMRQDGPSFNWYGQLTERPKEKRLNSKLWGYQLLVRLGLVPEAFHVAQEESEARAWLAGRPGAWLLKCPFRKAGEGFNLLRTEADVPSFRGPRIIEPYLTRVLDLVLYYDPAEGEVKYHLCRATPEGRYLGGVVFASKEALWRHVNSLGLKGEVEALQAQMEKVLAERRYLL